MTERTVIRVDTAEFRPGGTTSHRAREVLPPGNWAAYDPFLMMAEDWFTPGTFGDHPHRGIETVTLVLEGELEHRDNHGGHGLLRTGDAQWMTAGRGIVHCEEPRAGVVHSLQLWVNLPRARKMAAPRYQDLRASGLPLRRAPGATLRVYSGRSGDAAAATLNHVPVTMVEFTLEPGASVTQELPAGDNAFFYVLSGIGQFGAERTLAREGQVAWLSRDAGGDPSLVAVTAEQALRAVLWSGPPVREPVVQYGPFVMNTQDEIVQAFRDYQEGRF